ncbi:MAG: hypothetical protein EA352_00435 [Gemmatimonadales bacterium]|nr:MAG: hypothetical protein EA352_00435 [Gemmatimonadales bacterium]
MRPALLLSILALLLVAGCARVVVEPPSDLPPPSTERPPPQAPPEDEPPPPQDDRATDPDAATDPGTDPLPTPYAGACPGSGCPMPALPTDVRALWVVRTSLVHPDTARAVVRRASAAGFNTLLVQVRGRGDAWYPSTLEPRPVQQEGLLVGSGGGAGPERDPLGALLEEARLHGLQVHGWVNVGLVASAHVPPTDPLHPALRFPESLAVPAELATDLFRMDPRDPAYLATLASWARANEDRVEGIYQSPVNPEIRGHVVSVVTDLVSRYPLDGLHLDYIRYPAPDFDHSRTTLEAFRHHLLESIRGGASVDPGALARAEEAWPARPSAWPEAFPEAWGNFLAGAQSALLEEVHRAVRRERPELVLSAAVFADRSDARQARFQPWDDWLRDGLLDVVVPMAYTTDEARWARQVGDAVEVGGGARVWAGIGIWQTSLTSSVTRARQARQAGAAAPAGIVLFSYDWAVGPLGESEAGGGWLDAFADQVWGLSPR